MKYKKQIIIAVSIIATLILINYIFVAIPEQKRISAEYKKELKVNDVKAKYGTCKWEAIQLYDEDWASQCSLIGKSSECSLAVTHAERIGKVLSDRNDRCFEEYKLELNLIK